MDATERENRPRQEPLSIQSSVNRPSVIPKDEPCGRIDIDNYDMAVLIASGWGIIPQVPYLFRGCRGTSRRLQRIQLVCQLEYLGSSRQRCQCRQSH
jgi:hypothetical protein